MPMNAVLYNVFLYERDKSWRERSSYSAAAQPEISQRDKKQKLSQAA